MTRVGPGSLFVKLMWLMIFISFMNVRDVDLNLLRVFDGVLRARSVTAASAELGMTQPAVSNALGRLRGLFSDSLFVRTAIGMEPTPLAQHRVEHAQQVQVDVLNIHGDDSYHERQ